MMGLAFEQHYSASKDTKELSKELSSDNEDSGEGEEEEEEDGNTSETQHFLDLKSQNYLSSNKQ